jgi:hypothetical protein
MKERRKNWRGGSISVSFYVASIAWWQSQTKTL